MEQNKKIQRIYDTDIMDKIKNLLNKEGYILDDEDDYNMVMIHPENDKVITISLINEL